jgi:hypothetical protein
MFAVLSGGFFPAADAAGGDATFAFQIGVDATHGDIVEILPTSDPSVIDDSSADGPMTLGLAWRARLAMDIGLVIAVRGRLARSGLFDGRSEGLLATGPGVRWRRGVVDLEAGIEAGIHGVGGPAHTFLSDPHEDPSVNLTYTGGWLAANLFRTEDRALGIMATLGRDQNSKNVHASW